jgi:ribosomal protein L29
MTSNEELQQQLDVMREEMRQLRQQLAATPPLVPARISLAS